MSSSRATNEEIANVLDQIADLLERQDANPFRIQAYRNGADTVRTTEESIAEMVRNGGVAKLVELPHIGKGLARIINSTVHSGRIEVLERLRGEVTAEEVFKQVPGIGDKLARCIVEELDISTLEGLEMAAHDGRLQTIEGFGPKRVRSIRLSLAGMLGTGARRARQRTEESQAKRPDVEMLLDVDKEYRHKAEAAQLHKIAPRRFNPEGKAWLPILHTERDDWDFTALYSNTARAHELDKTADWVVLYYERDGEEGQATAVTETRGSLEGRRVVRGREAECGRFYKRKEGVS